ncbi:hypothetical protein RvY_18396 [Ramazzottius varieornatus]|uniref:Uncharacterized protein n=1 Tax=Ramazzottius varieornatus TaxID=947166 RepID=A0A1D1W8W2_RAMVA|nr:hypothetical protein RvY_18396 [Ramazzottius varieornatus]
MGGMVGISQVDDITGKEDAALGVGYEGKDLSEEKKLKKEEKARKIATAEAALTQLLEAMSVSDHEGDLEFDDEKLVHQCHRRASSEESEAGLRGFSGVVSLSVPLDPYDSSDEGLPAETDGEGFDEFLKLLTAEETAEKLAEDEKKKKEREARESGQPEIPENKQERDDEDQEIDEHSSSDAEDLVKDIRACRTPDTDEDSQENEDFSAKLLNVLYANCGMTDEELKDQGRELLGNVGLSSKGKSGKLTAGRKLDESGMKEEEGVRKVLGTVSENKEVKPRMKNASPFEVDAEEADTPSSSSVKVIPKKDRNETSASQQKQKVLLPWTSGSDTAVSGAKANKRLKSEERTTKGAAAALVEVEKLVWDDEETESMDVGSLESDEADVEVMDVESPSEASTSTGLIFEARRLRFEAKDAKDKSSTSKSPKIKPPKLPKRRILSDDELDAESLRAKIEEDERLERLVEWEEKRS